MGRFNELDRMKIITEPTVVVGEECEKLAEIDPSDLQFTIELQKLLQQAFESGVDYGESKRRPDPVVAPAVQSEPTQARKGNGVVPPYRADWDAINEDGPVNDAERFIFRQCPHRDAEGVNVETWMKQFHNALVYAAKH